MEHALAKYREAHRVSAAKLAKDAGTTRQTIHRIEKRQQNPSLDLVASLIRATGNALNADDFLPPASQSNGGAQ